ncbi:MAG: WD40 repeat domain-containing protein [Ktedonobacterales bacterium]
MQHYLVIHPTRLEAITAHNTTLTRWSLQNGTPTILTQASDEQRDICALAVAPEGEYVALASLKPAIRHDGEIVRGIVYPYSSDVDESDGDTFLPCEIEVCHWQNLAVAQTILLPDSKASILSMCFSPDGRWIAAADGGGCVYLVDRLNGQIALTFTDLAGKDVSGLRFDPASTYLTIGDLCCSWWRRGALSAGKRRQMVMICTWCESLSTSR